MGGKIYNTSSAATNTPDLGTTYSCVGIWANDRVEIIANDQGNRTTPSYVAFADGAERLIGDAAKNQAAMNPRNTVFDAKRLIGRRFDDPDVKKDMKHWPFTVADKDGAPVIEVDVAGERKQFVSWLERWGGGARCSNSPEEARAATIGIIWTNADMTDPWTNLWYVEFFQSGGWMEQRPGMIPH